MLTSLITGVILSGMLYAMLDYVRPESEEKRKTRYRKIAG